HRALAQQLGELGQDPPRQRNVPRLHRDPRGPGEGLHDRQQRGRGQERRLVGEGVDDLGGVGHAGTRLVEAAESSAPLSRVGRDGAKAVIRAAAGLPTMEAGGPLQNQQCEGATFAAPRSRWGRAGAYRTSNSLLLTTLPSWLISTR